MIKENNIFSSSSFRQWDYLVWMKIGIRSFFSGARVFITRFIDWVFLPARGNESEIAELLFFFFTWSYLILFLFFENWKHRRTDVGGKKIGKFWLAAKDWDWDLKNTSCSSRAREISTAIYQNLQNNIFPQRKAPIYDENFNIFEEQRNFLHQFDFWLKKFCYTSFVFQGKKNATRFFNSMKPRKYRVNHPFTFLISQGFLFLFF